MRRTKYLSIAGMSMYGGVVHLKFIGTFKIKTWILECTYPRTFQHSQLTLVYVVKKYMQDFKKNPNWTTVGVQHHVRSNIFVDISVSHVYRSKRKAIDLITGDE